MFLIFRDEMVYLFRRNGKYIYDIQYLSSIYWYFTQHKTWNLNWMMYGIIIKQLSLFNRVQHGLLIRLFYCNWYKKFNLANDLFRSSISWNEPRVSNQRYWWRGCHSLLQLHAKGKKWNNSDAHFHP
jgi:hypothetical protein